MRNFVRQARQPILLSAMIISLTAISGLWSTGAQAVTLGTDVSVGMLGAGYELSLRMNDFVSVRAGRESGKSSYTDDYEQIEYKVKVDTGGERLTLQLHPLGGPWFFSAGLVENAIVVGAEATPSGSYTINGVTYNPSEVGNLGLDIEWPDRSVYYGTGWDWSGRNWGMKFDLGFVRQRNPDVTFTATGTAAGTIPFDANLAAESEQLEKELDDFNTVPVVRLTFGLRF
jgi:hypothetical protein